MMALKCEICGGKLTAKSGGIFECEYCGLQYDKTRVQEMVQEIKGTVKVEGTVDVKGTVKIDGPVSIESSDSKNTLLNKARRQLSEKSFVHCIQTLFKILDIDPECSEAHVLFLCCTLNCKSLDELPERMIDYDFESIRFKNAIKYGDSEQVKKLESWKTNIENKKNSDLASRENAIALLEARRKEVEPLQNMIQMCSDVPYLLTPEGKIRCMEPNNVLRIYDYLGIYKWKNIKKFNFLHCKDLVILDYLGNVYCMLLQEEGMSDKKYIRKDIITDGSAIDICEYLGYIFILKKDGNLICFKTINNSKTYVLTDEPILEIDNVKQLISYKSEVYCICTDGSKKSLYKNICKSLPSDYEYTLYNSSVRIDGTVYCKDSRCTKNEWRNVVDVDFIRLSPNFYYDVAVLVDGSVIRARDKIGSVTEQIICKNVAILKSGKKKLYAITDDGKFLTIDDDKNVCEEKIFESIESLKKIGEENYEKARVEQDEILKEKRKLLELKEKVKILVKERDSLSGLFSGGRKRELQSQIDSLLKSITEVENRLKEI